MLFHSQAQNYYKHDPKEKHEKAIRSFSTVEDDALDAMAADAITGDTPLCDELTMNAVAESLEGLRIGTPAWRMKRLQHM
jgi:hypothetical protein